MKVISGVKVLLVILICTGNLIAGDKHEVAKQVLKKKIEELKEELKEEPKDERIEMLNNDELSEEVKAILKESIKDNPKKENLKSEKVIKQSCLNSIKTQNCHTMVFI